MKRAIPLLISGGQAAASGSGSGAPTDSQYVTLATDATLSAERVLTAGGGIKLTDGGAGSTITVAADMLTKLIDFDDFLSGNITSGTIGKWNWISNAGNLAMVTGIANHPGILQIQSSATGGVVGNVMSRLTPANAVLLPADTFDLTWVVRQNATADANLIWRAGISDGQNVNPPNNGIYVEHAAGDAGTFGVCRTGGATQTRTAQLVAEDTSFHTFRMFRQDATTIVFTVDGGVPNSVTTNVPTAALTPWASVTNNSAAANKTLDLDLCLLLMTLTR